MPSLIPRLPIRFSRDKRGNVAMITALCAIPLFGMLGFAIDYGTALANKTTLDQAADVATVAAVNAAQTVLKSQGSTAVSAASSAAVSAAQKAFSANAGKTVFLTGVTAPVPSIVIAFPKITVSMNYNFGMTTNFSKIIGIPSIPVRGSSVASATMPTYIEYYVLVDISQSMGIGATQTDMTNLYNRSASLGMVNGGCVFGCHVTSPGDYYSMEYVAHDMSPRITLRIDSAVTAIQDVITQAKTQSGTSGTIKIGLYTMTGYPMSGSRLTTVTTPTNNFSKLTTLASTIDLGPNDGSMGYGDSDFGDSLASFNALLTTQGDGSSASAPIKYVVIITDGVEDNYGGSCYDTHCTQAFPASLCTPLQAKAHVGVIYTTYNVIYNDNISAEGLDSRYQGLVYPFATQIAPNLQSCASSSSLYFEASDGPALIASLQTLFASTTRVVQITQ